MSVELHLGDCLDIMRSIPDKSVDAVITDPPYGTTSIEWDKPIDLDSFWKNILRIAKDNSPIIVFSSQPFTTDLIMSNRKMFRYELIWEKTTKSGFLSANKKPLKAHENIIIFYKKFPTYNVIFSKSPEKCKVRKRGSATMQYGETTKRLTTNDFGKRYPTSILKFSNWNGSNFGKLKSNIVHPTQKPVSLISYLLMTYSNPGDTIFDPFMGSGTTGVACVQTGRNFIGIEIDEGYYKIAEKRIKDAQQQMRLPL